MNPHTKTNSKSRLFYSFFNLKRFDGFGVRVNYESRIMNKEAETMGTIVAMVPIVEARTVENSDSAEREAALGRRIFDSISFPKGRTLSLKKGLTLVLFSFFFLILNFSFLIPNYVSAATIKAPVINLGLIAHYTFDGKNITNGRIDDASASAFHGSTSGISTSTFYARGRIGQAADFDGTNDYVSVPYNAALNINGANPLSVSLWFKLDSLDIPTNRYGLIARTDGTSVVNYEMGFNITGSGPAEGTGSLVFMTWLSGQCVCGSYTTTDFTLAANQNRWVHAVGVWDGTNWQTYVDGVLDSNNNFAPISGPFSDTSDVLTIGAQQTGASSFTRNIDGQIDDVRIYNRALSTAEIKRLYNIGLPTVVSKTNSTGSLSSGLVGHWTFDGKNITDGRIDDASGQGNHGNASGISTSTFYTRGVLGQAGEFDGTNDYVNKNNPYVSSIFGTTGFTLSGWAKFPTNLNNGATYTIACGMSSAVNTNCAAGGLYLVDGATFNQVNFVMYDGAYKTAQNTAVTTLVSDVTAWHHYVGVVDKDNSLLRIYVDGTQLTTTAYNPAGSFLNPVLFDIGRKPTPSSYAKGTMDDIRIYNRVLSTAEIKRLYNLGRPTVIKPTFLLDRVGSADVAYSVRKLRAAYTGDAMLVRRSSDSTTQAIGFNGDGNLRTDTLTSFCAGTDCFVTTWYDQSGNGRNLTQATAGSQPKIVSSGVINLENGKPYFQTDGTDDFMSTSNFGLVHPSTYYVVFNNVPSVNTQFDVLVDGTASPNDISLLLNNDTSLLVWKDAGGSISATMASNVRQLATAVLLGSGSGSILRINNGTENTSNPTNGNPSGIIIGRNISGGSPGAFRYSELIVYQSAQNATVRNIIRNNINNYYKIY